MDLVDLAVIGGGQSGLAAAYAGRARGLAVVVLEAAARPVGSWPRYYDSLTLFSPARFSALPGLPFGGDGDRYPRRDEVVEYLARYAAWLNVDIRTGTRVGAVHVDADGFMVNIDDGPPVHASAVVAATGGFGNPYQPPIPGLDTYQGALLHAATYTGPASFAGQRVVVVGAGNTAVQIAVEIAETATVSLASRGPVRYFPQRPLGRDLHVWLTATRLDTAPLGRLLSRPPTMRVVDDGRYRAALRAGRPDRRPLFTGASGTTLTWADGATEQVDAIILATGYQPDLEYLAPLSALDEHGHPHHRAGVSTVHPALGFVGLEWQRSLSSATLRGAGRDADRVVRHLAAGLPSTSRT